VEGLIRHGGKQPAFKFGPLSETLAPEQAEEAEAQTQAANA
jgi:hypothetical protein